MRIMLKSLDFILRTIGSHGSISKQETDVVRFVFAIVPFGSSVHDGLGGVSWEAVGIM